MGKMSKQISRNASRIWERKFMEMTIVDQERAMYKNGITANDLQKSYEQGVKDTNSKAQEFCFKTVYAAFLIEMVDNRGMDRDEAIKLLRAIDHQVVNCIEDKDLIEEAYERAGAELVWDDPIERIQ